VKNESVLRRIDATAAYLHSIASAQLKTDTPDLDRLLDAYLEARQSLAREFRELASSTMSEAGEELLAVKRQIQERMIHRYASIVPSRLLVVHGYTGVHGVLLNYLSRRVRDPVPASRLRLLIGDQIHTERRVRELRELGFDVTWKRVSGEDQYVLVSLDPDFDSAAKVQLGLNLRTDRSISAAQKKTWLPLVQ
jgi:hypothetical protein